MMTLDDAAMAVLDDGAVEANPRVCTNASHDPIRALLQRIEPLDLLLQQIVHMVDSNPDDKLSLRSLVLPPDQIEGRLLALSGHPEWVRNEVAHAAAIRPCNIPLPVPGTPLGDLVARFELDALQLNILLLSAMPLVDRRYAALFSYAQQDKPNQEWPTLDLALTLLGFNGAERLRARATINPGCALFRENLVWPPTTKNGVSWTQELKCDPAVFAFLIGAPTTYLDAGTYWLRSDDYLYDCGHHASLVDTLRTDLAWEGKGAGPVLVFRSPVADEVLATLAHAAAACERDVLCIDCESLPERDVDAMQMLRRAARETRMRGDCLVLCDPSVLTARRAPLWQDLTRLLTPHPGAIVLMLPSPDTVCWLGLRAHKAVTLTAPALSDVAVMIKEAVVRATAQVFPDDAATMLATRFRPSPQLLKPALAEARIIGVRQNGGEPDFGAQLGAALAQRSQREFGALAQRIAPMRALKDVIGSLELNERLNELLQAVKHREATLARGFSKKVGRATGIAVLFHGESGTGKTLTAEAIANELGVDLIKVDLATVVNKYIGETEKNLSKIFDLAERDAGVLFFDEADALFGKRSETKDSHDRHANIEVSYLLQRLEAHNGLVILSTNHKGHLDEAFSRRFSFSIEFSSPGPAVRRRLWESAWPKGWTFNPDVSLDELAGISELSGGNIRNVALAAAWLATATGDGEIRRDQIMLAIGREFEKIGRLWFK